MTFPLVIVESPFAGKSAAERLRNVEYLSAALRDCLVRGEAPFASHGLYTLPNVLDDTDPDERSLGIAAGLAWGFRADRTVVYQDLGISSGMLQGIAHAAAHGRLVECRSLPAWYGRKS